MTEKEANAPICLDCANVHKVEGEIQCKVSGEPEHDPVEGAYLYPKSAGEMRWPGSACGPDGLLFTQRVIWFGSQRPAEGD